MKDMEVDTLSHISWSCTLTVHSENSKDLFSFPSTNETLGESRNRKKQKNTTTGKPCKADRRGSKSLSETARIEMRQSGLLKNNQSQQSIMLYKITHEQSNSSSEED